MNKKRVVITGLGVISPNATGKDAFWAALEKGISGIKPVSLFDTSRYKTKAAGEIKNFIPQYFLGEKGLRTLDRTTKLAASATKLALDDARLDINEDNCRKIGVSLGTALGSIKSITDFDKEALTEGARYVNPALFPNTVINSPASQISIKFNIKGFNATVSTGFCASLDAVIFALDQIRLGRINAVLAGGVEELCLPTFYGFYRRGCLAGIDGPEISSPFDKRRNGLILGEGAAVILLEELESALLRKARIYAEVKGAGMSFGDNRLAKAMSLAMEEADMEKGSLDYICSAANSTVKADLYETKAIKENFGASPKDLYVSSIKSMIGESFSAAAAMNLVSACGSIAHGIIPPTINYAQADQYCDLNYVVNNPKTCKIGSVMINSFGFAGGNSSIIISRYNN
ncbi:MAG: beta-ketoacyl-[acyl-carrier-protein] synthase family protein [Candidatus Omnitrophota bacterium]|jgi:3-oxoacyl-[acyl-carrier-protein] synthase II